MNPGLYVHVPFCLRQCPYCDFFSVSDLTKIPLWLNALDIEVSHQSPYWTYLFDTVYLGGGSPSLLAPEELLTLKAIIHRFKISSKAEITLEANPEDVTDDKTELWASFGVNRLSLGVQSFQEKALTGPLGRSHKPEDIQRAISSVRKSKLPLSIDLIFAWPGQTLVNWLDELETAAAAGAEHISAYCLTLAPGSPLAESIKSGLFEAVPEDLAADMFLKTGSFLKKRGFGRYEVSNLAKKGAQCRHNLKYWHRDNYLGLGPSAHSFDGTRRSSNVSSVDKWAQALANGHTAVNFIEDITFEQAQTERIMLALRLAEGVPLKWLKDLDKAEFLAKEGYLANTGAYYKPTEKGFLASDFLARSLA
ncbi:MAG: radical SAM family heme chaperone HemW [Deltaproteobacteria bacterium]|jgi:oxygen-independent coproporphyrinogen-3 oxidase|nr:radical SAM family heme chaperone HemW [Deltaproteobacteria bacterium]